MVLRFELDYSENVFEYIQINIKDVEGNLVEFILYIIRYHNINY